MRRVAALSAMVMALGLAHAVPAEARPVGQSWYRLKEGVVKLTRADATLTQSQRFDYPSGEFYGVLRTHTQYVGGRPLHTSKTFKSANGDVSIVGPLEPAVRQAEHRPPLPRHLVGLNTYGQLIEVRQAEHKPLLQRLLVRPAKRERLAMRPVLPSTPQGTPRWHPIARRLAPNYRNMR